MSDNPIYVFFFGRGRPPSLLGITTAPNFMKERAVEGASPYHVMDTEHI